MRHINEAGLKLIKLFEGFSPKPYRDIAGYSTIGWGHLIDKSETFGEITPEEGEALLKNDLASAEYSVLKLIKVVLSDNQFAALVSFTFNLGGGALQCSTLRSRLNRGWYLGAADEFPKWCFAGGKKNNGLFKRRIIERDLFLT